MVKDTLELGLPAVSGEPLGSEQTSEWGWGDIARVPMATRPR